MVYLYRSCINGNKYNLKIKILKTTVLTTVLCGYETWSLTLREEHRLWEFENRVLGRMVGSKREFYKTT
jgi:hypothetical protein